MKKILTRLTLLALVLMLALAPVAASACSYGSGSDSSSSYWYDYGVSIVKNANRQIAAEIAEARADAKYAFTEAQLDYIINRLVNRTNSIANNAIWRASLYGVTAVCEYKAYTIGGRTVWIDPLKVVYV